MKKILYNLFKTVAVSFSIIFLSSCKNMVVLDPKGPIGHEETFLIYMAIALMLVVVVPVFVMVLLFSIRYRASNKKATYKPMWAHSSKIEWVIWSVPIAIIIALSYLTYTRTHQLDPYKPIQSPEKPVQIEVVSLDWNWLFIYPDYDIATVNELVFPANIPLSFRLTSATVMTSFFIPQLGSQMYAMAGMQTHLNLMAEDTGTYMGHNMEYSGKGYNTMYFNAIATTPEQFKEWIQKAKQSPDTLSMAKYKEISKPIVDYPVTVYSSVVPDLTDKIISPFMGWMGKHKMKMPMDHNETMNMNKKNMEDK